MREGNGTDRHERHQGRQGHNVPVQVGDVARLSTIATIQLFLIASQELRSPFHAHQRVAARLGAGVLLGRVFVDRLLGVLGDALLHQLHPTELHQQR